MHRGGTQRLVRHADAICRQDQAGVRHPADYAVPYEPRHNGFPFALVLPRCAEGRARSGRPSGAPDGHAADIHRHIKRRTENGERRTGSGERRAPFAERKPDQCRRGAAGGAHAARLCRYAWAGTRCGRRGRLWHHFALPRPGADDTPPAEDAALLSPSARSGDGAHGRRLPGAGTRRDTDKFGARQRGRTNRFPRRPAPNECRHHARPYETNNHR